VKYHPSSAETHIEGERRNNLRKEKWLINKQGRSRRNGVWPSSFSRTSPVLLWPNLICWKVKVGKAGNEIQFFPALTQFLQESEKVI
jgi:hypothetical protein